MLNMMKSHHLTDTNDQMEPKGCNPVEASGPDVTAPQKPAHVKATGGNRHVSSFPEPPLCTSQFASLTSSDRFSSPCSDRPVDFDSESRDVQNQHLDASSSVTSDMSLDKSDVQFSNSLWMEKDLNPEDSPSPTGCPDEETALHFVFDDRTDIDIWDPPSAENEDILAMLDDQEDEDDDDEDNNECGDGLKWGKSSSLNSVKYINKEPRSSQFKEKNEKKRKEVMNGKFKNLVSQLLKTVGVVNLEKEGESWVDTVSSLAWDAALSVKPDAAEGKAMDPVGYVKVKCVATGSVSESKLIKGLVFKKHAAHKHMATKYTNPTLMLIQGMLGHSTGLSSFNSMIAHDNVQKKDNMAEDARNLLEHLEACRPNVVLMEKSAPRDALETILKMGVTLVVDMKLHRLERIARCTGSPIWSANNMQGQKLKRCNLLYFERFVEEHAQLVEGGKNSHKTLMFLEDHKCLGCTILLKGSHIEELKKIKSAVQCAVVMAYHFILETSFLMDQEVMLSTISSDGVASERDKECSNINSSVSHNEGGLLEASADRTSFPLSSGFHEEHAVKSDLFSTEQISSCGIGSLSFSNWKDLTDTIDIPMSGSTHQESIQVDRGGHNLSSQSEAAFQDVMGFASAEEYMKPYLHLGYKYSDTQAANSVSILPTNDAPGLCSTKPNGHSMDGNLIETPNISQPVLFSEESVSDSQKNGSDDSDEYNGRKDDISVVFSESILVLMSSRNANRGTVCQQNHFSHIKFYRNFDVPFGMFLRDNVLNQSVECKACGEHPEAHFYYYAHHNKQLTIRVKRIPGAPLPGESSGKLWMWSRCGKCKSEKEGKKNTTNLVLVSNAARGLSFGKFLELSFSNYSSLNSLSKCGHSLYRDFLYFFGLGSMVSMFRYSPVAKYTVAVPPQKLEFNAPIEGDWLQKETEYVHTRVALLFKEVSGYLRKIETRFSGLNLNINGSIKEFMVIEKMLAVEILEFEENVKNNCIKNGHSMRKLLCLNRLRWELFLEACVWNRRLQLLSSAPASAHTATISEAAPERLNVAHLANKKSEATSPRDAGTSQVISNGNDHKDSETCSDVEVQIEFVPSPEELDISMPIKENSILSSTQDLKDDPVLVMELLSSTEQTLIFDHVLTRRKIPVLEELGKISSNAGDKFPGKSPIQPLSNLENSRGQWVWNSFSEIREECMKDLHNRVNLPSFLDSLRFDTLHSPEVLPTVSQIISEEGLRMHIPLCSDDYVVCDYEGEISSIIACALGFMKDVPQQVAEKSRRNENESVGLPRAMSVPYPPWSLSSTSREPDMLHPAPSMSFLESGFSSFDGSNLVLASLDTAHPEIPLGKTKYSVVCVYAKEFRGLRNLCCPSELDYIASLSRCKIWDAKGGKSRAFFAKTLDDRFILKEIKRTEFESFMKFASEYFKYMKQSFESGNQTCLAKILGIYQVTVRLPKGGKETKHDLVVIEHLSYGRNLSRQYDLKGALHARYTANADGAGDVLLDQNFVNDMNLSSLYIGQKAKRLLQRAVWNDTTFLNSINVMDYSLLVGVDLKQKELVCGIIDYLRQYTWDKQLETWVKSSLVVPKNVLPTIISPKEYKKRFRKFMDTHFLTVPDQWC